MSGAATELKAWTLGASVPLGAVTLMGNYMHGRFDDASGKDVDFGGVAAAASYALSKRTSVYGALALASGDLKDAINENRIYQLGMRVAF